MKAIIMAGGKGTRISSVRSDIPKPMIEICGKPILQYQIENLKVCGITEITLVIGHLGSVIQDYFKNGEEFGVSIQYFVEEKPLGTAGALFKMLESGKITDDFLLLCGDIIFDIDFNRFITFHRAHNAYASLMSHPNGHPYDSSLLVTETLPPQKKGGLPVETHRVIKWLAKEDERAFYKNRTNAGIEIISPELLKMAKQQIGNDTEKIDLDRDVLKPTIASGRIYAYDTSEYIKDMGTPDRFYETESDILSGKVHARNLSQKQKAIFFDRDGTLNKKNGFITRVEDFELSNGAAEAVKRANKAGYLAIVVTNQPIIARGDATFEDLQEIHKKLETELGKQGAFIDAIYFCPHHTDKGFDGERIEYKCDCECRKPKPGMLLKAAKDFNIDLSESYMIGDSTRDAECGRNAGCKKSFQLSKDLNLLQAVEKIC